MRFGLRWLCRSPPRRCVPEPRGRAGWTGYGCRWPSGASLADCQALVGDWLAGWDSRRSLHGPALIITAAREAALAGEVGLGDRGEGVVELTYEIVPDRRGRGYATRAMRLAARWLLREGRPSTIELRIDAGNTASQWVAVAAGYTPAGTIRSHVPATGETHNDLRLITRQPVWASRARW